MNNDTDQKSKKARFDTTARIKAETSIRFNKDEVELIFEGDGIIIKSLVKSDF